MIKYNTSTLCRGQIPVNPQAATATPIEAGKNIIGEALIASFQGALNASLQLSFGISSKSEKPAHNTPAKLAKSFAFDVAMANTFAKLGRVSE